MKLDLRQLTLSAILAWFSAGCLLTVAAFLQILIWPVFMILGLPLLCTLLMAVRTLVLIPKIQLVEQFQIFGLISIWLLHATGLIVPETGFDAVWYHLPVAAAMVEANGFVQFPSLYQSLNPLFSDILFIAGYGMHGELGAKIVAYSLAIALMFVTYQLARVKLTRFWSLWVVITVSTFQVVSWQASSFYVDVAKAIWEISALWLLVRSGSTSKTWQVFLSGCLLGATIGTKAFSWLLLPVFLIIVWLNGKEQRLKLQAIYILAVVLIAAPFYLRPWIATGDPFLSISLHLGKLNEIGGDSLLVPYLWQRFYELPFSLIDLTFVVKDYVSLILLVFLPLALWQGKTLFQDKTARSLLLFGGAQYLVWWFVPPLSTRYAISGFIVLTILWIYVVRLMTQQDRQYFQALILALVFAALINLAPRIIIAKRNVDYLVRQQSKLEYLEQFYDGSVDQHLKLWHGLE